MAATVAAEVVLEEAPVGAVLVAVALEAPEDPEVRVDREEDPWGTVLTAPDRMDPMARTLVTDPRLRPIAEVAWDA